MADEPVNGSATNREYLQAIHKDAQEALKESRDTRKVMDATNIRLFGLRADPTDNGILGTMRDDLRNFIAQHDAAEEAAKAALAREDSGDEERQRFRRNFLLAVCTAIIIGMGVVAGIVIPIVMR